ncbi:MAG: hypothetical protein JSR33_06575 [Proteobacteria bacterium]|nr:hypothetical protein [Pseudomonadota bacterium]
MRKKRLRKKSLGKNLWGMFFKREFTQSLSTALNRPRDIGSEIQGFPAEEISDIKSTAFSSDSVGVASFSEASTSSSDTPENFNRLSFSEQKGPLNEWEVIKGVPVVVFPPIINQVLANLLELNNVVVYPKGGAARDPYLGFQLDDYDLVVVYPPDDAKTLISLQQILKMRLNASKSEHNNNLYTIRETDTPIDITLTTVDNHKPDHKINSFALTPVQQIIMGAGFAERVYCGQLTYNKQYFDDAKSALEHLMARKLIPPGDPVEHYSEDIIRIIRGCRHSISRRLMLPEATIAAMSILADRFSAEKILTDGAIYGRLLADFRKLKTSEQPEMLNRLQGLGILPFLFELDLNSPKENKNMVSFNYRSLFNLVPRFALADLLELHLLGCKLKKDNQGYIPWIINDQRFVSKPQNSLILLKFCLQYKLSFKHSFVRSLFDSRMFELAAIKNNWLTITRLLRMILCNGSCVDNFTILEQSGILAFLFPQAAEMIKGSYKEYMLSILKGTEQSKRPSISFIYSHLLALEVFQIRKNTFHEIIREVEQIHHGRYKPIMDIMKGEFKGALFGIVTTLRGLAPKSVSEVKVTNGQGTFVYKKKPGLATNQQNSAKLATPSV